MSAFKNSSLVASDTDKKSLLKKMPTRISKQDFATHKMFGSKRKGIQLSKNFRKKGKGVMHSSTTSDKMPKSSGISPSIEEFDAMMDSVVKKGGKSKKSMFQRKQFD
jgi:hypothetical protein